MQIVLLALIGAEPHKTGTRLYHGQLIDQVRWYPMIEHRTCQGLYSYTVSERYWTGLDLAVSR